MKYKCLALAAFGLEGLVAKELKKLGIDAKGERGGASFFANYEEILKANIYLRIADRILLILKEEKALTFDEIFNITSEIEWYKIIPAKSKINIKSKCVRSKIMSTRDCQSIVKKAIIKSLQKNTNSVIIDESGSDFNIDIAMVNDLFRISLNTSGEALNKRGYRTWNVDAPIKETLAAAMLDIAPWRKKQCLYDPCCGSGTFLVEAAFMALNRPAGLSRHFDIENWNVIDHNRIQYIKEKAENDYMFDREISILGSDIDQKAVNISLKHIKQAGLENRITVTCKNLNEINLDIPEGCFIVNPPYGERLEDVEYAHSIYRELGNLLKRHNGWGMAVISNDINFEKYFGKKAKKKRKVYNARLECNIFIY